MQFRRIVAGIDFTEASLAAVRWTARHLAPEAELVLVHVVSEPGTPSYLEGHLPSIRERLRDAVPSLHGALRGLANLLGPDRTRIELLAGTPADALALVAAELEADLICVGRGAGRRGSARFGATTPQRLLARTRLPVLVVSAAPADAPKRILVGVDDRPGADAVVRSAMWLARMHGASVSALHVLESEFVAVGHASRATAAAERRAVPARIRPELLGAATTHALDGLRLALLARGWVQGLVEREGPCSAGTTALVREGDAGQELVACVHANRSDLVVVGRGGDATHARLPVGALALGSTARLVLWAAPCPVLVCPLDARDARDAGSAFVPAGATERREVRRGPILTLHTRHRGGHVEGWDPDDAA